eukprot:scaffold23021_cov135-Isochrysis_galbana.AAC.5
MRRGRAYAPQPCGCAAAARGHVLVLPRVGSAPAPAWSGWSGREDAVRSAALGRVARDDVVPDLRGSPAGVRITRGAAGGPTATEVTPSPTDSTMPPASWPRMAGNRPSGSEPSSV